MAETCPTCTHPMQILDHDMHWCGRCGTIRDVLPDRNYDTVPSLWDRLATAQESREIFERHAREFATDALTLESQVRELEQHNAALAAERDQLREVCKQAAGVLFDLEYSRDIRGIGSCCPDCESVEPTPHYSQCQLAQALEATRRASTQPPTPKD